MPPEYATYLYDVLYDNVVVRKAGATVLPMKSNTLTIPKAVTGAQAYWVAEATAPPQSDMTFEQITLTAKKVAAYTVLSQELLEDSSPAVDRIIMDNLAKALAVEMDKEFLLGDGTNITGIVSTSGVNIVHGNAFNSNGDLTIDAIIEAKKKIEENTKGNIKPNAIVMHPAVYYKLMRQAKDTTGVYLWNTQGLTANLPDTLLGMKVFLTTTIPIDLAGGSGNNDSLVIVGDFKQALIGERRGITIKVTAEGQYMLTDTLVIMATARVGFNIAYPEAFAVIDKISAV